MDEIEFRKGKVKIDCNDLNDLEYAVLSSAINKMLSEHGYEGMDSYTKENGNEVLTFKFHKEK